MTTTRTDVMGHWIYSHHRPKDSSEVVLVAWDGRYGFGTWHEATRKWLIIEPHTILTVNDEKCIAWGRIRQPIKEDSGNALQSRSR